MQKFILWLRTQLATADFNLQSFPADAGFRQYFRVQCHAKTYVAVISPPATEKNMAFIDISRAFSKLGLITPTVLASELTQGFLLLSDLGDKVLQHTVTPENANELYQRAFNALAKIQACDLVLPHYGSKQMSQELQNFVEWFLIKNLHLTLSEAEQQLLQKIFKLLIDSAITQPQCCVHWDYHSRNLMILPDQQIGILDFQDAMRGPITYDLVSLIKDCYVTWPPAQVERWLKAFYLTNWQLVMPDFTQMHQWFDFMGIHRHLRAIFIFARKFERDGSSLYLADIPRALQYIIEVSATYPILADFNNWLTTVVIPRLQNLST